MRRREEKRGKSGEERRREEKRGEERRGEERRREERRGEERRKEEKRGEEKEDYTEEVGRREEKSKSCKRTLFGDIREDSICQEVKEKSLSPILDKKKYIMKESRRFQSFLKLACFDVRFKYSIAIIT
jgi:hypothetical protein